MKLVNKILLLLLPLFISIPLAYSLELSHAVGQMMLVGFYGTSVNENSTIVKEIKKYHIGGVILVKHRLPNSNKYAGNIENPIQLKKLIEQLQFYAKKYTGYPLFIAVNQEGGLIKMLKESQGFKFKNDFSQSELGKIKNQKINFNTAYQRALELKNLGINLNLAPVADLNINPDNPAVGKLQRSFGDDPLYVTQSLQATIDAYKKAGVLCTLKHFPGLGSAKENTDYDKADLTDTWTEKELLPYEKLIESNKVCPFIMTSHLINRHLDETSIPASLSRKVVTGLLIDKLHYKGLIITDDMDAAAIRKNFPIEFAIKKAVLAGNNILIFGGTQDFNPDEDSSLLFHTLMHLAKNNPEIHSQVLKSYYKIINVKNAI